MLIKCTLKFTQLGGQNAVKVCTEMSNNTPKFSVWGIKYEKRTHLIKTINDFRWIKLVWLNNDVTATQFVICTLII